MADSYDLTKLGPEAFEHLVNSLALRTLGSGHTSFGPGSDGGRDGYFNGEAPYPSTVERWSGVWYIQSKFHRPHLSKDAQKWLIEQITEELKLFANPQSKRIWPNNWIIATNIDPSGTPNTGSFDKAFQLIKTQRPELANRFHIWGGRKILDLLTAHPDVAAHYGHFLTPGHIISELYEQLKDERASVESVVRYFVLRQFEEQQHTKLEQAGSDTEARPGIHKLFIDLPFRAPQFNVSGFITRSIGHASARCHRTEPAALVADTFAKWSRHPQRARVWFIKGGPGQGKSTIGQFFSQIQRAALILEENELRATKTIRRLAQDVKDAPATAIFWPTVPRIPVFVELKDYAQWFGARNKDQPIGILTYLCTRITVGVEQTVSPGILKRALGQRSWLAILDGLDEVPDDVKDAVATEVKYFIHDVAAETNSDLMAICTSRPQGYSGQFSGIDGPVIELSVLPPAQALQCAIPVIKFGRNELESEKDIQTLRSAIESQPGTVRELMTTPLQAHIMAVVIREGGKPPDRRWQLFSNFYHVIKRRETNRDLPAKRVAKLLREDHQLLKTVHNRLGFVLHSRAETSEGAQTSLDRTEFGQIVQQAVQLMIEEKPEEVVSVLMQATTDRLVLVNTPDDGKHVRFDIRPLQEFFAAEFLYESVDANKLRDRLKLISADAHWREVMHFLLSALVENGRLTELDVATQSLIAIDEYSSENRNRIVSRRLAKGAMLAARLLQEGVLEQDKRSRQQFRACLGPLAGSLHYPALAPMESVTQPSSRAWLLSFLFDQLKEADKTENIGAAIILCIMLSDLEQRTDEIKQHLMHAPINYTLAVISIYSRRIQMLNDHSSNWMQDVCYSLLVGDRWQAACNSNLRELLVVLTKGGQRLSVAARNGLSRAHSALLDALLMDEEGREGVVGQDLGVVNIKYHKCDWSVEEIECGFLANELPDECSNAPGILQGVYWLFYFAKTHSPVALREMAVFFCANLACYEALPSHLRAYAPIGEASAAKDQLSIIANMDTAQLNSFIAALGSIHCPIVRLRSNATLANGCSLEQWRAIIVDHTDIAVVVWSDLLWTRFAREKPSIFADSGATNLLVDQLLSNPAPLLKLPRLWGRFLTEAPVRSMDIRKAILRAAKGAPPQIALWGYMALTEVCPFVLDLPNEAPLLPHILSEILHFSDSVLFRQRDDQVPKLIKSYVPNRQMLVSMAQDPYAPEEIKCAAFVMDLLHWDAIRITRERSITLTSFYAENAPVWILSAILLCAKHFAREDEYCTEMVVSELLLRTRDNYIARMIIESFLADWRERSSASISAAGVQNSWLAGSG